MSLRPLAVVVLNHTPILKDTNELNRLDTVTSWLTPLSVKKTGGPCVNTGPFNNVAVLAVPLPSNHVEAPGMALIAFKFSDKPDVTNPGQNDPEGDKLKNN
jgi:hypothetical protein